MGLRGSAALADDDEPFDLGFGSSVFSPGQSLDADSAPFKGVRDALSSKVSFIPHTHLQINDQVFLIR